MVFSSIPFLFLFAPATLGAHALSRGPWRNALLLVASLAFYALGGGGFVLVLVVSTYLDHVIVGALDTAHRAGNKERARRLVATSVTLNLGMLAVFKYANFLVDQLDPIALELGMGRLPWAELALPIGISFFTFQRLSYVLDVHWRVRPPLPQFRDLLLFVSLFPQLIAGPIVRYDDIAEELRDRRPTLADASAGAARFALGLGKKVLVADTVAPLVDELFAASDTLSSPAAALALIAYGVQLYYDFSGYSDMAIGLGRILGFRFPENFAAPFTAMSVTDFWRRWHITLSTWFRDYLYVPLGGSRGTTAATYRNLLLVFVLTGVWHGAAWTFVVWGLYHGVALLAERITGRRWISADEERPRPLARARTFTVITLGWALFRAPDLDTGLDVLLSLAAGGAGPLPPSASLVLDPAVGLVLVAGLVANLVPRNRALGAWLDDDTDDRRRAVARLSLVGLVLPLSALFVLAGSFSPFLYFRF